MKIIEILEQIIHPEHGKNIVELGMVQNITENKGKISLTIQLLKTGDPLSGSIRRAAEQAIIQATGITPSITVREPAPVSKQAAQQEKLQANSGLTEVKKIIAIASGKGGVGKSTVTANLAYGLSQKGYKVGVLDADIYGPSMPKMFGVEDYVPLAQDEKSELILPAQAYGVKIMSIGFFIKSSDALVWRGPMATSALRQLIHQTAWGELDYLLIDLPPGTGDVHLTVVGQMKIDGAYIVTTPQMVALADVVRGIAMFRSEGVDIPVMGIIENMAYFVPADMPDKRYYIFGRGNVEKVAAQVGVPIVATLPIDENYSANADRGTPQGIDLSI